MPSGTTFSPSFSSSAQAPLNPIAPQAGFAQLDIAGVIGLQLAEPLSQMQQMVHNFLQSGKISRAEVQQLGSMIDSARKTAMQSQQLARLANGRLRQSLEKLRLDILVTQALAEHMPRMQQLGIVSQQQIHPVEVIFDPGLLISLVDAGVEWMSLRGHQLDVALHLESSPEFSTLRFTARPLPEAGEFAETPPEFEKFSWYLLMEIARTMGVKVTRSVFATETTLTLEFQRSSAPPPEALDHPETRSSVDSWQHTEAAQSGTAPLLVTADDKLRRSVEIVCLNMGLVLNVATTSARAARHCAKERPPLIIFDDRADDDELEALKAELAQTDPFFPLIEIVHDANTLLMSSWMSDSVTRVSVENLRTHLPRALMMGLSKKK
ncbi:hypothetical protein [Rhodoferax koreensis]|uniref:hypothetical protein n=1 Tax=Rhodoferax koreensis TaxID=1842727 RepID=UPI0012FF6AD2|nr:hypothetical protein [Rhodoferax koreense]